MTDTIINDGDTNWKILCQFICENTNIPTLNFGRTVPYALPPPKKNPLMQAGLSVVTILEVPSWYYRVPQYFFMVINVAQNRWYRPTLLPNCALQYVCVRVKVSSSYFCMPIYCRPHHLHCPSHIPARPTSTISAQNTFVSIAKC